MKMVTKYKANDGAEFDNANACKKYEQLCAEIDAVMATLPRRPADKDCKFANGHGYLQHNQETFLAARAALLTIGNRLIPHKWFQQSLSNTDIHPSWCGRLIDEVSAPLSRAWLRISCVDKEFREWGQPYFANNPDKVPAQDMVEL